MAFSVKLKFAGFLRGLLHRMDDREPARPAAPAPVPAAPVAPPPAVIPPPANADSIELPLATVVAALPIEMRAKLMAAPMAGKSIQLPAETVISQLAFGAVKISFGELRQLAPGTFVNSGGELDNKSVNLPLAVILPRINSALLARRAARKVEVSAEISGPFADRGRGFTFTTQPLKAPAAPPPPPPPEPAPEPVRPIAFVPPAVTRQVAPPPVAPQFPSRSITPAAPAPSNGNGRGNGHALPASSLSPRAVTPATNGPENHSNGNGHGLAMPPSLRLTSNNGNEASAFPPTMRMAAAPVVSPLSSVPSPRTEPTPPTIFASLGDLCENWPEELKHDILSSPLARANVPLDGAIVMPGLKRGRVLMTWKQLRVLAQPSSAASPRDSLELELPLNVIAPLFLAAQKNSVRPRAKTSVSAEIPDLFFGFPQLAAAPVAQAAPVVPPLPKPPEQRTQDTNYYVWGEKGEAPEADEAALRRGEAPQTDFMSRQTHPKEVVQRATMLPGVIGAVVAMQDGLRVASQAPAEFNPDTLAAFLPQIFERVSQSTRELRMGALNNLNFTVGNVPWRIFRVNALYFAVFGRAGESLPAAPLAQLAAELDRKKQK